MARKKLYEEFGEMLFTHFGVSGPIDYQCQQCMLGKKFMDKNGQKKELTLQIDLKPALSRRTTGSESC